LLQPLWWRCVDCVTHHERDVHAKDKNIYAWCEQAVIEWSRRVISIVACYHGAKLCAHAARDLRSQQYPEHIGGKVKTGWSTLVEKHCFSEVDPGGAIAPGKTYKLASFMHDIYSPWLCTIWKTAVTIQGHFAIHCFVTAVLWTCEVYIISLTAVTPQWDSATKYYWNHLP